MNKNWNLPELKNFICNEVREKLNKEVKYVKRKDVSRDSYFIAYTETTRYTFRYLSDKVGNLYLHPYGDYTLIESI